MEMKGMDPVAVSATMNKEAADIVLLAPVLPVPGPDKVFRPAISINRITKA